MQTIEVNLVNILEYIYQFFHNIKMPKGASAARARGVLIVKELYKCTQKS